MRCARWYDQGRGKGEGPLEELRGYQDDEIIVLDTETTGLDPEDDEVLSLAVIDGSGSVLMSERFGTERAKEWPEAQAVNGISPDDVAGLPSLRERAGEVTELLSRAKLIIVYNAEFDLPFLEAAGVKIDYERTKVFDPMIESAAGGGWSEWWHDWIWSKLVDVARHYGYGSFGAHDALEDARATLFVFRRMLEDPDYLWHFRPDPHAWIVRFRRYDTFGRRRGKGKVPIFSPEKPVERMPRKSGVTRSVDELTEQWLRDFFFETIGYADGGIEPIRVEYIYELEDTVTGMTIKIRQHRR